MMFIPNPYSKHQINHIDGDKHNNRIDNLEWCNQSENQKHACGILKIRNKRFQPKIKEDI